MNNILPHVLTTTIRVLIVMVIKKKRNILPPNTVLRLALPLSSPGALGKQSLVPADLCVDTRGLVGERMVLYRPPCLRSHDREL